ncbi:MAG TPA: hypothetical protein VMT23_00340 [Candidatus Binatia bacterium]|nr:hypothetical protein [Candidatus Binatia bacterium]
MNFQPHLAILIDKDSLPQTNAGSDTITIVLNIFFTIIGAIAVLIIVISGFRYIRAGSNETIITEARRQMVHAIVGLIVTIMAAAIVNFVLSSVK